ncbi:MAG: apolipoprotein N-acyltransferase [Oligosphaeraceae bacterium]
MTLQWPVQTPCCRDLRFLRWLPLAHWGAALVSGLLLATAFPPLEWWPMAFLGLVPYLAVPQPRRFRWRLLGAYTLGFSHFAASLWWLNSVGFGAGILLALYCACYPACWALLWGEVLWRRKPRQVLREVAPALEAKEDPSVAPGASLKVLDSPRRLVAYGLLAGALWVALEWLRGWLFTGFPWNPLGASQAFSPLRLLATLAGAYGISFLAVLANVFLADLAAWRQPRRSLPPLIVLVLFAVLWCAGEARRAIPASSRPLRIVAIQGNVPECRQWDMETLQRAWGQYGGLTREAAAQVSPSPDLFLWPEGALPCELTFPPFAAALKELLTELPAPLLLGSLDERILPGASSDQLPPVFNSAFLLTGNSPVLTLPSAPRTGHYDKTHLVPFGEYVPFGETFPWLQQTLGMGRDLTPGRSFPLFSLKNREGDAFACGVNICFEDAFPGLSRKFVRKGAQLLATITNDCWYGESSGPRQHLAQAVMRAVENRRPLLRSGNNSHTCLISPKGELLQPILSPDGSPFGQGWQPYTVHPVAPDASPTLYARTGDALPATCLVATALTLLAFLRDTLRRKSRLARARRE